jgi:hypothetical protein
MKKEKRDKLILGFVAIIIGVLGVLILTYGDTDRYDGKLSKDEMVGIGFILIAIGHKFVYSFLRGLFKGKW